MISASKNSAGSLFTEENTTIFGDHGLPFIPLITETNIQASIGFTQNFVILAPSAPITTLHHVQIAANAC